MAVLCDRGYELKACDAFTAQNYQMMGGSAQDLTDQCNKVAGDAAAPKLRDCVQAAGSDRKKAQACEDRRWRPQGGVPRYRHVGWHPP